MNAPAANRKSYFEGFDYLRTFAIMGVIFIHGCDTHPDARYAMKWLVFSVPCFFMMSAFLTQWGILRANKSYTQVLRQKFIRLAPAYAFWSAVYLALRLVKGAATGESIDSGLIGCVFWGDASYQLYFVPMLFYGFVIWTGVMLMARRYRSTVAFLLVISAVLLHLGQPLIAQWFPPERWFIAPNLIWFPLGMLGALVLDRSDGDRTRLFWPSTIALGGVLLADVRDVTTLSILVFLISLSIARQAPERIKSVATLSYGIYLVHVLFIEVLQAGFPMVKQSTESLVITLTVIALSAVFSYALCRLLYAFPSTRWMVA